jgi:hypothetical protein
MIEAREGHVPPAAAILVESALSFLGFGPPPPTASWGSILNDARGNLSISDARRLMAHLEASLGQSTYLQG